MRETITIRKLHEIIVRIVETPQISTTQFALDHGVIPTSIRKILNKEKAYSFKDDLGNRMEFCDILHNLIKNKLRSV